MSRKTAASTLNRSMQLLRPKLHCFGIIKYNNLHTTAKEIKIPVPWGHVSAKLWGQENQRPVLALHGWQDNAGTWDPLAPMISDKLPILAIDFPGHGHSSWIPPGFQYYPWDLPRLILTIRDYFKWDKISILGHSMGSIAGMRFACVFPDDVDFYIAVDSLIYDDYDLNQVVERFPKILRKIQLAQTRLNDEPPSYTMDEITQKWYLGTNKSVALESVQHLAQRGLKASSADPNKFYFNRDARLKSILFNPENKLLVGTLVKRLKCPTLYFKAIDSPYASDEYSVEMREVVERNNAKFESHFVPGTHHVQLNNPERLAPTIITFLQKYNFI
ncbi:unnamed protein product [Pieris macdunnoughi]|uniref:AB hydrolase-1 domain-containing protein n=1 Tax=Pieris macdunnoughi TaxID=345717 RepID=A0A821MNK2_9NEOP|nr:unnamed protein product [Pieris macdunnoughi]